MPFAFRRGPIEPAFVTTPTETPPAVAVEARIDRIDRRTYEVFKSGDKAQADRLLDLRNAIRPAKPKPRPRVPYTPGRTP